MTIAIKDDDSYYKLLATYIGAKPGLMEIMHAASRCEHVSEVGLNDFAGTMMILGARPQVVRCYDNVVHNLDAVRDYAASKNIDFAYVCNPQTVIDDTDMLVTACHLDALLPVLKTFECQVSKYIAIQRLSTWDRGLANATINHFMQTCLPWHIYSHVEDAVTILYRR